MAGKSLLFAFCILFFVSAISAKVWQFSTNLDPSQEVPPVVITPNENTTTNLDPSGKGRLYFDDETNILNWTISNNVVDPTSAHLHGPAAIGTNANPIIPLDPTKNPMVGQTNLTATYAGYLQNGTMYVNIHTAEHPAGLIRGQVIYNGYEAVLTGENVVPKTNSSATGNAVLSLDEKASTLTFELEHTIANATSGGIHGPADDDQNTDPIVTFTTTTSPIKGKTTLNSDQVAALKDGKLYIQLNSNKYPNGEIRGSIVETGTSGKHKGLSTGVIVLIVFICIGAVVAAVAAAYIIRNKRKKQKFEVVAPTGGDYIPPNF